MAARSCDDCRAYFYDDKGEPLLRRGEPVPRPPGAPTPCRTCPKVPAGADPKPASAVELSPEHRETVRYYEECRAVGHFPDDPVVRWAARVLRAAADHCDKVEAHRTQLTVISAVRGE